MIKVVDLFAGPGGLGEGFSSYTNTDGIQPFRISLSVEKDPIAHRTLELRSFFRQYPSGSVPEDYYKYLRQEITHDELFSLHPKQARQAKIEAMNRELGEHNEEIDARITEIMANEQGKPWLLIGGPPCQAYSQVGRSRMSKLRKDNPDEYEGDKRHYLYKEYLRILAKFQPDAFVMENVTGILSHRLKGKSIFDVILADLKDPSRVFRDSVDCTDCSYTKGYRVYSLIKKITGTEELKPSDFVINCEMYGIPQARHRVVILGIREDYIAEPGILNKADSQIAIERVIGDLPRVRSALSKEEDSAIAWNDACKAALTQNWMSETAENLAKTIVAAVEHADIPLSTGSECILCEAHPQYRNNWYYDVKLRAVCNHKSRSHIRNDLHRYLFAACYASLNKRSPVMQDFPNDLLPDHKNVRGVTRIETFSDRFRVQLGDKPATTITCHISKDGHYYIHYDASQCRSLTVREAARIQTFPDNYFFEGARTFQYKQVGNAVPPLLALQIADVVYKVFRNRVDESVDRYSDKG